MIKRSAKEIQKLIGGRIIGEEDILVSSISSLKKIKEESVVFIKSKKFLNLDLPYNLLLIIPCKFLDLLDPFPKTVICVEDIEEAFAKLLKEFHPPSFPIGISEKAVIKENVKLGEEVYIGELVIIESDVRIGRGVKIFPGSYIGHKVEIDENTVIYPNVTILDNVKIGKNCIIQSGSVLGSSGFGYIRKKDGYEKISQIGSLIIEDNVEIGSLVAIDRGTIDDTLIKKGTKIDSLVKIAHNVVVGQNNIITSQVGIAGSSQTGDNVIMGGQSGVADHVTIGDNVIIAADAGVISDLPSGAFVSGSPAINHKREYKAKALMYKLPEMVDEVKKLKKELVNLKKEIKKDE